MTASFKQCVYSFSLLTHCFEHLWSEGDCCACVPVMLIERHVKWDLVADVIPQSTNQACLCFRVPASASWEVPHASAEDEGLYECIVRSSAGEGRALTQLTVRGMSHAYIDASTHTQSHPPASQSQQGFEIGSRHSLSQIYG